MALLQWRGVDAPDLSTALRAYQAGSDTIGNAFKSAKDGLKEWEARQVNETSNQFMAKLMTQYQNDPEGLARAAQDGSLMAGYNPTKLSAEAIASIGARGQDLQNFKLGTSNIRRVDLGNENQVTRNTRDAREFRDYEFTSNNSQEDTVNIRGLRDLELEHEEIIARDGPAAGQRFLTRPDVRARLMNTPQEYRRGLTDRSIAVPQGEADLDNRLAGTAQIRDTTLDGPYRRDQMGANTAQIRDNTLDGPYRRDEMSARTGSVRGQEGRAQTDFDAQTQGAGFVANSLANDLSPTEIVNRLKAEIGAGRLDPRALGHGIAELNRIRPGSFAAPTDSTGAAFAGEGANNDAPPVDNLAPAPAPARRQGDGSMLQAAPASAPNEGGYYPAAAQPDATFASQWMPQSTVFDNAPSLFQRASMNTDGRPGRATVQLASAQANGGRTERRTSSNPGQVPGRSYGGRQADSQFFGRIVPIEGGTGRNGEFLTSPAGAIGPAQVMPGTAPEAARLAGLKFDRTKYRSDPEYNLALGRAYYGEMLRQFGNDPVKAAAAYNAGPGSASKGTGVRGAMARATRSGRPGDWTSFLPGETKDYVAKFSGGAVQPGSNGPQGSSMFQSAFGQPAPVSSNALEQSQQLAQAGQRDPLSGVMYGGSNAMQELIASIRPREVEQARQMRELPVELPPQPIMLAEGGMGRRASTNVAALLASRQAQRYA